MYNPWVGIGVKVGECGWVVSGYMFNECFFKQCSRLAEITLNQNFYIQIAGRPTKSSFRLDKRRTRKA